MAPRLAVIALLIIGFCAETQSFRIQKREVPAGYLEQMQGMLASSWDHVSTSAQGLLEKVKEAMADERLTTIYSKGSTVFGTYKDVLSDQFYHWWQSL